MLQKRLTNVNYNNLVHKVGKVYEFDNIKEALIAQDKKHVDGKIVVRMKIWIRCFLIYSIIIVFYIQF